MGVIFLRDIEMSKNYANSNGVELSITRILEYLLLSVLVCFIKQIVLF